MSLPQFEPGRTIVIEEQWQGQLWSAIPSRVVRSTPDVLVSWEPTGTVAVVATNRGLAQAHGLSRSDRKLLAMETMAAQAAEFEDAPDKLYVHRPGRWARVNLGWDSADHRFLGWYVNFERPPEPTDVGVASKDLVLDLWVDPDRSWAWKDREDFDTAIERGVLSPELRSVLHIESEEIVREIQSLTGPFSEEYVAFTPEPTWSDPELPSAYQWGGNQWRLPRGHRVAR